MKKISRYFLSSTVALSVFIGSAFADDKYGVCKLLKQFEGLITVLRILAFVGAAFVMMEWAWGYIKDGTVKKDDLKDKGVGMLVGFTLLFGVGVVLSLIQGTTGAQWFGCDIGQIFTAAKK